MLYQEYLRNELEIILKKIFSENCLNKNLSNNLNFSIDISPRKEFGDLSSNIAMVACKILKLSPIRLAEKIVNQLNKNKMILKLEIVKPGFINFFFKSLFWQNQLQEFLDLPEKFDYKIKSRKICLEYVSANPTGQMHIGHARGAILGDSLFSILCEVGHKVTGEYYINDAGEQINKLIETVKFHLTNTRRVEDEMPDTLYPGDYLKNLTKKIFKKEKINVLNEKYKKIIIENILNDIKADLELINVFHQSFVSEKEISSLQNIEKLKKKLLEMELAYYGFQEKPKNIEEKDWIKKKHFLFRSKKFGDDSDRALIKPNGSLTYFMSDILYHQNKISRKFDLMINIWGVDHFGYVKRLKNVLNALNKENVNLEIKLTSLVNLLKKNKQIKMSKRSGNFITMNEVVSEVGSDAIRYMMISRNADKKIDFDLDIFFQKNKENPVFYIQYAYARCMSIIQIVKEKRKEISIDEKNTDSLKLNKLMLEEEKLIIKHICSFYDIIKNSAIHYEPHRISAYLYDLAKIFHNYWSIGNIDAKKRILIENDDDTTRARTYLVFAVKKVLNKGLSLLKIKCPNKM
ncbi:MAG: arginine--tRNA ligase [alpha proteobacterium MED-G10]|nr:MAG: arginine--tRNA ligase [alpha proteobacterium MED-G10]